MFRVVDDKAYPIPVLMRTLDIVELLSQSSEPLKFTAICSRTGIPRSTAYRILKTLYQRGYVHHLADGSYKFNVTISKKWHTSKAKLGSQNSDPFTEAMSSGAIERSIELLMGVLSEAQGQGCAPTLPMECKQCSAYIDAGEHPPKTSAAKHARKAAGRRTVKHQPLNNTDLLHEQHSA